MARRSVSIKLDTKEIEALQRQLESRYAFQKKLDMLCEKLASMGAVKASLGYSAAVYTGTKDIIVSVDRVNNGYAIKASGETVLFVEFGSGITYGYGHPQAGEFGYGPGTYPTESTRQPPNWRNPHGWWLPKEKGGGHTYGNPPSRTMYDTAKDLREQILDVAKAVFEID